MTSLLDEKLFTVIINHAEYVHRDHHDFIVEYSDLYHTLKELLSNKEEIDEELYKKVNKYLAEHSVISKLMIVLEKNDKFINYYCEKIMAILLALDQSNMNILIKQLINFISTNEFLIYSRIFVEFLKLMTSAEFHGNRTVAMESALVLFTSWNNQLKEIEDNNITSVHYLQLLKNITAIVKLRLKVDHNNADSAKNIESMSVYCFTSLKIYIKKLLDCDIGNHLLWKTIIKLLRVYSKLFNMEVNADVSNNDVIFKKFCIEISELFLSDGDGLNKIEIIKTNFCGMENKPNICGIVFDNCTAKRMVVFLLKSLLAICYTGSDADVGVENNENMCKRSVADKAEFSELIPGINGNNIHLQNNGDKSKDIAKELDDIIKWLGKFPDVKVTSNVAGDIVETFLDDDSQLNTLLYVLLQLYEIIRIEKINPHLLFYEVLKLVYFDDSVLIDWLLCKESNFAQYIRAYVKLTYDNPNEFFNTINNMETVETNMEPVEINLKPSEWKTFDQKQSLVDYESSSSEDDDYDVIKKDDSTDTKISSNSVVDDVMTCLIRFRLKIQRLWSYLSGLTDFVDQLDHIEEVYESNLSN